MRVHAGVALAAVVLGMSTAAMAYVPPSPVVKVLRPSDVPRANNQYLPSGSLGLPEFVDLLGGSRRAERTLRVTLAAYHFQSAAIAAYAGPWPRVWRSFAIQFASPANARASLTGTVTAITQGLPAGTSVKASRDGAFRDAQVLTMRQSRTGVVGAEIIASDGPFLYGLSESQKGAPPRRAPLDSLLARVIARS